MGKSIKLKPSESPQEIWLKKVKSKLVGKKIVDARYMDKEETESNHWYKSGIVLILNDGNIIYPISDDEGNDAGALGTSYEDLNTIPTI